MSLPLGIRSRNPGNLRPIPGRAWFGEIEPDPRGYCVFDTDENGLRALFANLRGYRVRHGLRTLERIIARWAPGSENDTAAYINDVVMRTGILRDQVIDLRDASVLRAVGLAIVAHENGRPPPGWPLTTWYSDDVVDAALRRAMA